jgi:hypothetical protein
MAQKTTVFGEAGLGFGQTLFFSNLDAQLRAAYGGSFKPGIGNNLTVGYYVAPASWRGLGLGARIKGTFGTSVEGDFGDDYIFNYYSVMTGLKYYPVSRQFNRGIYTRGSVGFGQMTTKRMNESTNFYAHQYAIGSSLMLGVGYSLPLKRSALSLEAEFEFSSRNGTISGVGDGQSFQSGQLGLNLIYSF